MGLFDIFGTGDQQAAANAQIAGINTGLSQLNSLYGAGQNSLQSNYTSGLQPFLQNYQGAQGGTNQLANVLGLNGQAGSQQAQQTLQATPGYQFQQQQGDNAINAQAAATGNLGSGNQATALSNYNQGLAGTTYNNYVSQLQPYLNYSNSSASGIGGLYSGLGNQLNSSYMNQGNAAYGANASIGNANANADLAGLNASANSLNALMGGANLGANLLGFFSDEATKDDIEEVGSLYDGQKVVRFRYKGDPRHQIGLIAQDVEGVEPDAVTQVETNVGPLRMVDYRKATDFAADLGRFMKEAA